MSAPIIFTDWIGTFGLGQGIVHICLEAVRHMPVSEQSIADRVIVAHLRMPRRIERHSPRGRSRLGSLPAPRGSRADVWKAVMLPPLRGP